VPRKRGKVNSSTLPRFAVHLESLETHAASGALRAAFGRAKAGLVLIGRIRLSRRGLKQYPDPHP
jgi:hypothetical protein